jgi:dTDP-4-amino-4,6-dideoxygalactose transaminase
MANDRRHIHLCLAKISDNGAEQKYIQEAFRTNWVAPLGPNVDEFEKKLESFFNDNVNDNANFLRVDEKG